MPESPRVRRFVRHAQQLIKARLDLQKATEALTTGDLAQIERQYPELRKLIRVTGSGGTVVA